MLDRISAIVGEVCLRKGGGGEHARAWTAPDARYDAVCTLVAFGVQNSWWVLWWVSSPNRTKTSIKTKACESEVAPRVGLEPTTGRLTVACSTN